MPTTNSKFTHPIIIDQDVENFRIKLDNMVEKFKLESISEIVYTKKCLLQE